jgi:hypothetical protein
MKFPEIAAGIAGGIICAVIFAYGIIGNNGTNLITTLSSHICLILFAISTIGPSIMLVYGGLGLILMNSDDVPIKNHLRNSVILGTSVPIIALFVTIFIMEVFL